MRVGQKNKLTYRWARTGSRPRAAHDQRTQSTYLFGAVCPELGTGAALVLPFCNSEAMQLHLNAIATKVSPGAHAIVILDQAGWHGARQLKLPHNISLMPLPPRSPELNSQENIWQFMRQNWLSNRVFKSYDDIVDHCLRLEHPHRSAVEDHVNRTARVGLHRSFNLRIGINHLRRCGPDGITSSRHHHVERASGRWPDGLQHLVGDRVEKKAALATGGFRFNW